MGSCESSECLWNSSERAFEGSKKIFDRLSPPNSNGNIDLQVFDKHADLPVKKVRQLVTPTRLHKLAHQVVRNAGDAINEAEYPAWKKIAANFFLTLAEGPIGECTSIYRLLVEIGENNEVRLMISFSAKRGVEVSTDPAIINPLEASCERNANGYSVKDIAVREGIKWRDVKASVDKQKHDFYSSLDHNDKHYMTTVELDIAG